MILRGGRRAASVALVLVLVGCLCPGQALAQRTVTAPAARVPTSVTTEQTRQAEDIKRLEDRADRLQDSSNRLITSIYFLVGILFAGGVLGVVFSIRDQSRISQLHELSVSAEISSGRRTEQSYAFFLDESQKTLTLVNDTLELAKEATEGATRTMQTKARSQLQSIEARAENLVLETDEAESFEELVDRQHHREDIASIAASLAAIEGLLQLQDVPVEPYSQFVKGIEQYLNDDHRAALQTLRHVSRHEEANRTLKRFALFWLGKLHLTFGEYEKSASSFREVQAGLDEGLERCELECDRQRIDFLRRASHSKATTPAARFVVVDQTLIRVEALLEKTKKLLEYEEERRYVAHEVETLLGDMYMWIAFDDGDLFAPFSAQLLETARKLRPAHVLAKEAAGEHGAFPNGQSAQVQRAWSILQALDAYPDEFRTGTIGVASPASKHVERVDLDESSDHEMLFGIAECHFMLRNELDEGEYQRIEAAADEGHLTSHREQRKQVDVAQIKFISKARDLFHAVERGGDLSQPVNELNAAHSRLRDKLGEIRGADLHLTCHLQRVDVPQGEFKRVSELLKQAADDAVKTAGNEAAPETERRREEPGQ